MLQVKAEIIQDGDEYYVNAYWSGEPLDRPHTFGWLVEKKKDAERLVRCVNDQAAFGLPQVAVDAQGQTYVQATACVMGRHLNADLKLLGY